MELFHKCVKREHGGFSVDNPSAFIATGVKEAWHKKKPDWWPIVEEWGNNPSGGWGSSSSGGWGSSSSGGWGSGWGSSGGWGSGGWGSSDGWGSGWASSQWGSGWGWQ